MLPIHFLPFLPSYCFLPRCRITRITHSEDARRPEQLARLPNSLCHAPGPDDLPRSHLSLCRGDQLAWLRLQGRCQPPDQLEGGVLESSFDGAEVAPVHLCSETQLLLGDLQMLPPLDHCRAEGSCEGVGGVLRHAGSIPSRGLSSHGIYPTGPLAVSRQTWTISNMGGLEGRVHKILARRGR